MVDASNNLALGAQKGSSVFLSVVIPVYRSQDSLRELYERLKQTLVSISDNFEIIMVNDASPDNAWEIIQAPAKEDPRVKGINLSRNFGQHHAITAGLDFVSGEWVVVMDCDLQDMPEEIPKLYSKAKEGYEVVIARRMRRQDSILKKAGSKLFYSAISYFTGSKIDSSIGNFGIYSKKVIQNITRLREQNRSLGLFAIWVGFRRVEIDVDHGRRKYGESSYTFRRLVNLALDSIVAHSNKLLRLSVKLGFSLSCLSFLYVLWLVISYFFWATPLAGWTSLIASIFFIGGLMMASIGIVGLYVGEIFEEVKMRPLYIIDSTTFERP